MKKKINLFIPVLIVTQIFAFNLTHAQDKFHDYFSGPEERKQHRTFYGRYAKEVLCIESESQISFAYSDKINITKESDFRKIGVNIFRLMSDDYRFYQKAALLSSMIVEGEVVKRDDDKNSYARVGYAYLLKVNEVLFDDLGFCLDTVKVRYGFMEEGNGPYLPGDKVILFLSPLSLRIESMVKLLREVSKYDEDKISDFVQERFYVSYSERNEYASTISDLPIIDGFVFDKGKNIGSKTDILKQIRSLIKINNKDDFYKIHK